MNHTWTLLLKESWLMNTGRVSAIAAINDQAAPMTAVAITPDRSWSGD